MNEMIMALITIFFVSIIFACIAVFNNKNIQDYYETYKEFGGKETYTQWRKIYDYQKNVSPKSTIYTKRRDINE